jgi:hypothetical protein
MSRPNDLIGLAVGATLMTVLVALAFLLFVFLGMAMANPAAESAIFRACAEQARLDGDSATAELFMSAVKGEGVLVPKRKPSRGTCAAMRTAAEMYVPMLKPKGQQQ